MYQITNLNLIPGSVLPVVNVSQYDKGRQFQLLINEGEYAYDLTGKTVTIRGTKPDMHGFDYGTADGVLTVSGNVVNVFTTQQMTAVAGQVMAELRIASGSTILGTINFIINVEESALSDDTIISDTEIPVIERDFEAALAEAEADALASEGYAKGTQDGTPVGSESPYYHDNAKHYKEEAEAAASGVLEKYPKIVSDYWYVWDVDTNQYVNTGVRAKGTQGDPGEGVPAGGTTGQVLRKKSDDNYDTEWGAGGGGASALDDLTDVDITSPTSGQGLLYDGAGWVNGAVATPAQLAAKLDVAAQQVYGAYNLLKNNATAQVVNGVTVTINADLSVTLNGTVGSNVDQWGYSYVDINTDLSFLEIGKTYYLSGCPSGGSADTYYLQLNKTSPSIADFGNEAAFTVASGQTYTKVRINMKQGMTFNNHVFKPMIALQSGMPYAQWVMTNKALTDYTQGKVAARVVATAASGTYSSVLSALYTAYQSLSESEKRRSRIYLGGNVFHIGNIDIATYFLASLAKINSVDTMFYIGLRLSNGLAYRVEFTSSGSTFLDWASETTGATATLVTG